MLSLALGRTKSSSISALVAGVSELCMVRPFGSGVMAARGLGARIHGLTRGSGGLRKPCANRRDWRVILTRRGVVGDLRGFDTHISFSGAPSLISRATFFATPRCYG